MRGQPVITTARGTRAEAFGLTEWGLLVGVALMWGSSFLWIEVGLESLRPGLVTLSRIALGAAALALVPRSRRPIRGEDWPRVALLGAVWTAVPFVLFPLAQQWIDSSTAGMINGAMPLFTAVVASLLLRSLPGARQAVGLVVGFTGVVLVTLSAAGGGSSTALGVGLVLCAVALYGLAANLAVPLQQRYGALPVVFRVQAVALALVLPFGLASVPGSRLALDGALAMAVLGFLSTGLAFVFMATLVGRAGATRGAVAIYFVPVVATVLGVAFRDETVSAPALVGVGLIVAGAYLTSRRER